VASKLANEIAEIGKKKECRTMIGTVNTRSKNPTRSIQVLLGYGMSFHSCTSDAIIFKKEIQWEQ